MVRFINRQTGTEMWVDEARADEYKAAGHTPADEVSLREPETMTAKTKGGRKNVPHNKLRDG